MLTVPAHSRLAPVFSVVTAARRNIPNVCGVLSSSSSARMILTPCDAHRLAFPPMASLRMPPVQSTASRCADQVRFHPAPLAGLEVMSAATSRSFPPHTHDQYGLGVIDVGGHVSRSDRRQVRAGPGSLIFVNPGEVHDGRPIDGGSRTWRILYFDPQLLNGLLSEIAEGDTPPLAFPLAAFQDV